MNSPVPDETISGSRDSIPVIALLEDDPIMNESLTDRLQLEGFDVMRFTHGREALDAVTSRPPTAMVVDIRLPDMSGEDFYLRLGERLATVPPTLFLTGYGSIDQAVRLLKRGAADYLTKPVDAVQLVDRLRSLCGTGRHEVKSHALGLGVSGAMREIELLIARLAHHRETPVLITGESGAGKEEVARCLHAADGEERPFVPVNCTAIADSLTESELFGHEKGAFTGANRLHRGVFEQASGGTLFLDEIGDMSLALQGKLLRAIQERRVTRVGGEQPVPVDLRLICATHQNLEELVRRQAFREDLWYRINVIRVEVPPLRSRPDDVLWLAARFLARHRCRFPGDGKTLGDAARTALLEHDWPGNVRELNHALERGCILCQGTVIQPQDLFERSKTVRTDDDSLSSRVEFAEREHILRALKSRDWRIGDTAAALGIARKTLWQKMRRLGINKP